MAEPPQTERTGVTRVKELEEIVKKLEQENKQLLNKVRTNSPTLYHKKLANDLQAIQDDPHTSKSLREIDIHNGQQGDFISEEDDLENSLVDLENGEELEDEWLFVSPKLPPTPAQKKVTPVRWLLGGEGQGREESELPSIDDVRKTLTYNINEAENFTRSKGSSGGYSPGSISPRSVSPTNKTAQRYLNQVRQRRNSPPSYQPEPDLSPSTSPLTRARHYRAAADSDAVPIVKWRARQPPPPSEEEEEAQEEVPRVKWKVKQIPSDDVPKVRWNRPPAAGGGVSDEDFESEGREEAAGDDVPVVKWKARVPPSEGGSPSPRSRQLARPVPRRPPPSSSNEGVPVVKWKAKVPANEAEDEEVPIVRQPSRNNPPADDVPVVKWKAKLPANEAGGEDVPVVKWKAKPPAIEAGDEDVPVVKHQLRNAPPAGNQDVPVVKWKAKLPPTESNEDVPVVKRPSRNPPPANDVPIVKWKAKLPANEGADEDVPVIKRSPAASSPQQRRGLISPKRGGLTPPTTMNGDSDQSSGSEHSSENLRVSRHSAHQSGLQRPRSGSARSPSGLTRPARITSPGSTGHHSQISSGNSSSQEDIQSISPSSSRGGRLKIPQRQSDEHSSTPRGQTEPRRISSGLPQSSSRGGNLKMQRSTPPSGGQRSGGGGRGAIGVSRSAPSQVQSPRSAGGGGQRHLTPPSGSGNPRRTLPTPPSAGRGGGARPGGQRLKPARSTSPRHSQPQPPVDDSGDNDSWLEGCF